jgi:hypothetical protein
MTMFEYPKFKFKHMENVRLKNLILFHDALKIIFCLMLNKLKCIESINGL